MGFDKSQLEKDKDRYKKGDGEGAPFWSPSEGEHLVFLCPPARDASLPYYAVGIHYTGESGIVCADPDRNPLLKDPIFKKALKGEGKGIPESCPLCEGEDGAKPSVKFMMCVVPIQSKGTRGDWKAYDAIEVRPYLAPRSVWNGIADILLDVGESVCSVDGPVLIKIKREGRTKTSTKYTVMPDSKTLKETKPLGKKLRTHIAEAIAEDGPSDPYKILVRMFKSGEEMEAAGSGMTVDDDAGSVFDDDEKTEEETERDEDEGEEKTSKKTSKKSDKKTSKKSDKKKGEKKVKRPPCFAIDYDPDDSSCESCKIAGECKAASTAGDDEDDDGGSGDNGDDGDDLDALLGD
jgi:hypothetical protein